MVQERHEQGWDECVDDLLLPKETVDVDLWPASRRDLQVNDADDPHGSSLVAIRSAAGEKRGLVDTAVLHGFLDSFARAQMAETRCARVRSLAVQ